MHKQIIRRDWQDEVAALFPEAHPLLRRIYAARKVKGAYELERNIDSLLSHQLLLGMDDAVRLLAEAIQRNQKMLVVGDFDADGATSTAVAIRALRSFGAEQVQFLVPNRFAFGYGLTPELVASAKDFAPDMIITVDNGIANHAGVEAA